METPIFVAVISGAASLVVAALSYWLTKAREREADWRKQKLEHYRELLEAISGIVAGDGTDESQRRYARATNVVGLVASQEVIAAVDRMREASRPHEAWSMVEHDAALASLLLAIRRDLGIRPKDDPTTFSYKLWASGVGSSKLT
jgi:hypothetical protein